jgi:hypothetical protein
VTVTVAVPDPDVGGVKVKADPDVGAEVESVPAPVTAAVRLAEELARVGVMESVVLASMADPEVGLTVRAGVNPELYAIAPIVPPRALPAASVVSVSPGKAWVASV